LQEAREVPTSEPVPTVLAEPAATLKARTFRELARAEFAQTLIAAILITGLGYVLFAEKFVVHSPMWRLCSCGGSLSISR
jgi:hypothetical protein